MCFVIAQFEGSGAIALAFQRKKLLKLLNINKALYKKIIFTEPLIFFSLEIFSDLRYFRLSAFLSLLDYVTIFHIKI